MPSRAGIDAGQRETLTVSDPGLTRRWGEHRRLVRLALIPVFALSAACTTDAGPSAGAEPTAAEVPEIEAAGTSTATTAPDGSRARSAESSAVARVMPLARTGADVLVADDFALIDGLRVGLITNPVSVVDGTHLIDWLHDAPNVELGAIFAAEHGVRGAANAGELLDDSVDPGTGVPILSLYGQVRQPTEEMLEGLDAIVFDLQDVGTRYFTYTATMGLAMQSAAAAGITFVVLDRPNPLGGQLVEGFVRSPDLESFISQYPTPSVHGLTAGELALMIQGEGWLPGLENLDLRVVRAEGWQRNQRWNDTLQPWIAPSPGLQTVAAASNYPATVLFEATSLGYGAGTADAFQAVSAPWLDADALAAAMNARALPGVRFEAVTHTPRVIPMVSFNPHFEGEEIHGVRIVITDPERYRPTAVGVHLLEEVLKVEPPPIEPELDDDGEPIGEPVPRPVIDRPRVLDLLTGTSQVRTSLEQGVPAAEIVAAWDADVAAFVERSALYWLY